MNDIVIPKLGMTMTEGTIVEWSVDDGGRVESGDLVFVMSTDKLDTDIYAEASGTLQHRAEAGSTHAVGAVVGVILADSETATALAAAGGETVAVAAPPEVRSNGHRVKASPLARKVAANAGVDLATVTGTGPGGRIVKADVETAARMPAPAPASRPASVAARVPLTGMRKVIAERMHASLRDMAQLTLGMEVDMSHVAVLRRAVNDQCADDGVRLSFTDIVCRAAVQALEDHPGLNASVEGDDIVLHGDVHLGLAVAVPEGLLVPVVRDANCLSLADLSAAAARLAAGCRDGSVSLDDLDGSTFTVTALGASGVDFFTPVINPPNVAILGIGRVRNGVAWDGETPVRRQVMTLSLTIDHRAIDGAPGAAFLSAVKDRLESPYRLLV